MTAAPGDPGGARVEMRGESRDSSSFTQIGTQVIHQPPLPAEAFRPWAELAAPAGLSNLPRPGLFVGRADEMARLDAAMAGPGGVVVQAVHGLGGVGKSTLAARWAAAHAADYSLAWWITAASSADIGAGLAGLAVALQPALTGVQSLEALREGAVQWLAAHPGWLVILDNVTDPADVAPLLARAPGGRYLITSRRASGWHATGVVPVRLDVLDPAEAQDLLAAILPPNQPRGLDGAGELCAELGFLPLAIEQAGAYLAQAGATPREYLGLLARYPAAMYQAAPEGGDATRTIARIWHVTLDRLAGDPLAEQVLRILAWYAPDGIPRMLLDGLADPPGVLRAVGRLAAYSMLTADAGTVAMHRLVQAVTRTPDPGDPHVIDDAREQAARQIVGALPDWEDPADWPGWRMLLPHIDALASHAPPDTDTEDTASLLNQAGLFLNGQGQPGRAAGYHHRALADCVRVLGADHPDTLASRNNLAYAYRAAGDLGRAIPLYEQALADCVRVLGADHPDTLTSRNNLAYAYRAAGDLGRAIPLYEQALADRLRVLGADHPDTLASRNNLAGAYQEAGDLGRAVPLYEQALADCVRVLGADHPQTLASRNNLAYAYRAAGDLGRAIPLYEQALADCVRVLGADHPQTKIVRDNLAASRRSGTPSRRRRRWPWRR
jgi:tetratricopeptide (TPR) repeat protein